MMHRNQPQDGRSYFSKTVLSNESSKFRRLQQAVLYGNAKGERVRLRLLATRSQSPAKEPGSQDPNLSLATHYIRSLVFAYGIGDKDNI
ncbi:hypothetical protein [aff. Roholtiella sp. LEGE 12411]|uniref:hypothetical protein n=1 Tax=aff. Roholtiella sp. LEGE 12411 TaxID=1828822 RepID=UPI00187FAD23|nr:hypothetical protein [aff. Roholtiella sp. LEGE 12411]MBE9037884.1 hypothetical protein [aff. Roholtiella sp. LEGE 12411]